MAIVVVEGHRFDTSKAKKSWRLDYFDGHNQHWGALYLSSRGTWYVETPSQWSNGNRWELTDPQEAIERYGRGLKEEAIEEILEAAGLETE